MFQDIILNLFQIIIPKPCKSHSSIINTTKLQRLPKNKIKINHVLEASVLRLSHYCDRLKLPTVNFYSNFRALHFSLIGNCFYYKSKVFICNNVTFFSTEQNVTRK